MVCKNQSVTCSAAIWLKEVSAVSRLVSATADPGCFVKVIGSQSELPSWQLTGKILRVKSAEVATRFNDFTDEFPIRKGTLKEIEAAVNLNRDRLA